MRRFARELERYLLLFTKSANIDFLRDLEHGGHTIISWSLTCETASREIDRRTATLAERLDAMAAAQTAGYPVRARLSPIVPVRGWRKEYHDFFTRLFATVTPDVVTLELLGWMNADDLAAIIDPQLLDHDLLTAVHEAAASLTGVFWGPYPQAVHEEIYRFCIETVQELSPATPVSVCHGTPETWRTLGRQMRMSPEAFLCNCGPSTAPGGALYAQWKNSETGTILIG